MNKLNVYTISFYGLKTGQNEYVYDIDNNFFKLFKGSEITEGKLYIKVVIQKENDFAVLDFDFNGYVNVMCDRCLGYFDYPLNYKSRLIAKIGDENYEDDFNDIIYFSKFDGIFNIAQYIYDNININLPLMKVHPENENDENFCDEIIVKEIKTELSQEYKLTLNNVNIKKLKK